jgi:hypothetical protein
MNFGARIYKPALLGLALVFFCLVSQLQSQLNVDRKEMGLVKMDPLESAPPVLAFTTVALGGFRGLIANALWMRLNDLQLDDKYFEMVQLADWITKLQPNMTEVWQFQAWNMAYNISVRFKDYEDRWRWVKRGIDLLRDDGLRYNPGETMIYHDLSWLYQHKIGAYLDDAHMTYKLHWAQEMQSVLGTGHPDFDALINPTTPEAKETARKLREVYKMDPVIMKTVDDEYGPFDWRLPDAHAIYWAELGRIHGRPEQQETLRRSVYQSMQAMGIRGGALDSSVTNITTNNFILWPNLDQIPNISASYEKMIAETTNNSTGLQDNVKRAHKNFVRSAVYLCYEDGREGQARYWFNYLKTNYPTIGLLDTETNMSMEDFAVTQIQTDIEDQDMNKSEAAVLGMFRRGFQCLLFDNDTQAQNYRNLAAKIYQYYNKKNAGTADARVRLQPLRQLEQFVLDQDLNPTNGLPPWARAKLRTELNMPPEPPSTNAPPAEAAPAGT